MVQAKERHIWILGYWKPFNAVAKVTITLTHEIDGLKRLQPKKNRKGVFRHVNKRKKIFSRTSCKSDRVRPYQPELLVVITTQYYTL